MKADKSLEIKSAIITLKQLDNGNLIIMDKNGILRCLDLKIFKTISGFKSNISQERSWGNHMSVSGSGLYAACVIPHSNKAAVYNVAKKKLLYKTSEHKGDIESICIDDNNHYLITGGTDGRTFVYNLETSRLVYSFPPHADYITSLAVNNIWIVSASYDKSISVLNLTNMKTPTRLNGHRSVVVQMRLLKNMQMISADKNGNILLWNLKTSKLLHKFPKLNEDITCLSVSEDERFLFVGTKFGSVSLYSLDTISLLKRVLLKETSKVTSLCVLDKSNQIAVGTKSGRLSFYSLIPNEMLLISQLKNKEYLSLYKASEENPLLLYSPVFIKLETLWKSVLTKAGKMLELNQEANARVVLEPFIHVKEKSSLIKNLFLDYKEFNKFKTYINDKKYFLAYPMSLQYKHFQDTIPYKMMENEWHVQFNKAKIYIMDKEGDEKARSLLSDFKGISSKSVLIQELFKQRTAYMLFKKKLAQKDYISLFMLLNKCPFIKEFDEYYQLLEYADKLYIKAQQALDKKKYTQVLGFLSILLAFPDFKEDAKEMIAHAKVMEKFTHAFDEKDLSHMYELIGESPFLMELDEAKALEDDWQNHLLLAEKFASKGDIVSVIASLEDFFKIKAKYLSIALVLQQAYLSQLYRALASKKSKAILENAIKQYLVFFGKDELFEDFVEKFKKQENSNIELLNLQKGDINLFKPFMIIPDIVI
ncbi:MAG: hypothetical protein COA44_01630 [Arcobacter sp.]|nr:MAG: hypothetical protein COA44_01630 [Arcobacter sp.]